MRRKSFTHGFTLDSLDVICRGKLSLRLTEFSIDGFCRNGAVVMDFLKKKTWPLSPVKVLSIFTRIKDSALCLYLILEVL